MLTFDQIGSVLLCSILSQISGLIVQKLFGKIRCTGIVENQNETPVTIYRFDRL